MQLPSPSRSPSPVQSMQFIKMFPVSTIRTRSPPLWLIRVSSRTFHTLHTHTHTLGSHYRQQQQQLHFGIAKSLRNALLCLQRGGAQLDEHLHFAVRRAVLLPSEIFTKNVKYKFS